MKLSNIRLLVKDFDRCFTFYKDMLGLACTWGQPGDNYASFDIGHPSGLALFKAELMNTVINRTEAEKNETLRDKVALILQVENVDDMYDQLQKKGLTFLVEPKDMKIWGTRVVHFRDPAHNLIELYSDLPK